MLTCNIYIFIEKMHGFGGKSKYASKILVDEFF